MFNILESVDYMINIPTDSETLANWLDAYADDWGTVLTFIERIANRQGIVIKSTEVAEILRKKYE